METLERRDPQFFRELMDEYTIRQPLYSWSGSFTGSPAGSVPAYTEVAVHEYFRARKLKCDRLLSEFIM